MGVGWQLTGRGEELRFIDAATRRAKGPRGLVLAGEAGVGKTRLAREALARAAQRGVATRWTVATASARVLPFGAFGHVLGSVGDDPRQVLRRAGDALIAGADRHGVIVGVDDAHLLDELSATLVHQLVLQARATVVITVRTGEPAPDAVTALWKDGHLDRLEIQPLSEPETAALLEAVFSSPVDSSGASRMWQLTRGNVLYLRQLVEGEVEAGRLHRVGGVWRWSGTPTLSPGLAELVGTRMGALPEPVRDVVDVLALGEPLGVGLLRRLIDPLAVEDAEGRGLLNVEQDGRRLQARLAHPLYGEVRRADLGELRARRLRGLIATALADTGDRRAGDTLRRAVLTVDSDLEPDPQLLTAAAQHALRLPDPSLAEVLARAAVAAGGDFDPRLIVARALTWLPRCEEADVELAALAELAHTDGQRAEVAVLRAANLFWSLRRPTAAEAVLHSAAAAITEGPARWELESLDAIFHASLGRPQRAVEAATRALSAPGLSEQAILMATWGLVIGLGVLGRADEIGPVAARGYAVAARSVDIAMLRFGLGDLHIIALRLAGTLHEAERVAIDARQSSTGMLGQARMRGVALLGHAALARGRLRSAIRGLREARAAAPALDTTSWECRCLLSLTQALAMAGDPAAARQALDELEHKVHPAHLFVEPEMVLARAWVAAAEGSVREAITLAHAAADVAAGRGQLAHEVLALQTAVGFGDRTVADRFAELATLVDGPRAPAAAAHAAALAADDGDALRAASERLEEMGDLLAAADAAAHAAATYTRQGRTGSAHAAAARAHQLAELCEGAHTPALAAAARPLPLTEREREIVTLAARGLSNQEIAARLTVSVRTVEGHLYRASGKLGTTRRTELAALVQDD